MKILLGMSGGFDSTYAAKKLISMGHEVEGAVLVMHEHTDVASSERAAEKLGIPLHIIDCRELFTEKVKLPFAKEYMQGRTPNPCIVCNPEVKFAALAAFALGEGFDRIATGHYAALTSYRSGGEEYSLLCRAKDSRKDQTYMLYRLPQGILSILLLPMADEVKSELREAVKDTDLQEFDRPDSQEICFLPDGGYAEYVESVLGACPRGKFVDKDGKPLGEHKGIIRYTVGQRKGLGISLGERAFVTAINSQDNTVTLDTEPKASSIIYLEDVVSHINVAKDGATIYKYDAKVRYLAPPIASDVVFYEGARAKVVLRSAARSVTPGQSCVLYDGDAVIGGGIITKCE